MRNSLTMGDSSPFRVFFIFQSLNVKLQQALFYFLFLREHRIPLFWTMLCYAGRGNVMVARARAVSCFKPTKRSVLAAAPPQTPLKLRPDFVYVTQKTACRHCLWQVLLYNDHPHLKAVDWVHQDFRNVLTYPSKCFEVLRGLVLFRNFQRV